MESDENSFNGTALDDHGLKFNWFLRFPLQEKNAFRDKQTFVHDNQYVSSEFSISKTCHIKWIMICQKMSNRDGSKSFKIGLKRISSEDCKLDVFFSVKISFSNKEVSKNDSVEFDYSRKLCFTREMELIPQCKEPAYYEQQHGINLNYTDRNFWITGFIIARNCCKTPKEESLLMDNNISQMQQDFKKFFKNDQMADVTLNVRNESLPAHKFVLTARSPVFRRMFFQDLTEKQQNIVRIDDIEKSVLEVFLLFLYTGVLEDREFNTVFELYSVADKYEVTTLFKTCRDLLMFYVSIQTVTPVLKLADMHSDDELKDFAVKYISDNFSNVEATAEWEALLDTSPRLASYTLKRVSTNISKDAAPSSLEEGEEEKPINEDISEPQIIPQVPQSAIMAMHYARSQAAISNRFAKLMR